MATATATTTQSTQLHVGLFVSDLQRSIDFYRIVFGTEPDKNYPDYVEFSLTSPPLVLVLSPQQHEPGGTLNHVGLRFSGPGGLAAIEARLEAAGFALRKQEQVACCYARGNKIWLTDPDHNLWEIYYLLEDLAYSGFETPEHRPPAEPTPATSTWEYRLPDAMPGRIDRADCSLDEVRLCGIFNADVDAQSCDRLVAEAHRVLKPGGKVIAQGLVAATPFPGKPDLPGLAAKIKRVPLETEPLERLAAAGFVDLTYDELADIHCFQVEGVELRKLRISARKVMSGTAAHGMVLYKGPLDRLTCDNGHVFCRGEMTSIDLATWNALAAGPVAEQFVFFQPKPAGAESSGCCSPANQALTIAGTNAGCRS